MKIWKKINSFVVDNVGKLTLASGVVTIIVIGSVIFLPITGSLYTVACIGGAACFALTAGSFGAWKMREHTQDQAEQINNEQLQQNIMEYQEVDREVIQALAAKSLEQAEAIKVDYLTQKIEDLEDKIDEKTLLQENSNVDLATRQEEIIAEVRILKGIVKNLEGNIKGLGANPNILFSSSQLPEHSSVPSYGSNNQQFH